MKTFNFIDKNSSIVITCSADDEQEAINLVKDRIKNFDCFRVEILEE